MTQARDHVVQQPPRELKQTCEPLRVAIDLDATDVLNHADARDRVEARTGELAVTHRPDLDPVGDARPRRPVLREARLGLGQSDPDHSVPRVAAAWIAKLPQPQPQPPNRRRTRSPGPSASLPQTNSSFARWASSTSSRRAGIERHARCSWRSAKARKSAKNSLETS